MISRMIMKTLVCVGLAGLVGCTAAPSAPTPSETSSMQLGCFSVSLAVKDLAASRAFYEKLGFEKFAGDESMNYLIMKNGTTNIGLFQGMFEDNILTFNPGWTHDAQPMNEFTDVRDLQAELRAQGLMFATEAEAGDGPASFVLVDPDGNPVLVDQHVPRPGGG